MCLQPLGEHTALPSPRTSISGGKNYGGNSGKGRVKRREGKGGEEREKIGEGEGGREVWTLHAITFCSLNYNHFSNSSCNSSLTVQHGNTYLIIFGNKHRKYHKINAQFHAATCL